MNPQPPSLQQRLATRTRSVGEPLVWLCALGLCIGLAMVAGLLVVIGYHGITGFWPKGFGVLTLQQQGETTQLAAAIIERREKDPLAKNPGEEVQLFTGNKDIHGSMLRWVDANTIQSTAYPQELLVLDRLAQGPVVGFALSLKFDDHTSVSATDAQFLPRLDEGLKLMAELRGHIEAIEKKEIGTLSKQLTRIETACRNLPSGAEREKLLAQRSKLEAECQSLVLKANVLRQRQKSQTLLVKTYDTPGSKVLELPLKTLLHYRFPNQESWLDRTGMMFSAIGRFLWEDPREANTEGGVFPAIFGTFFMTLLMSLVVTPFGVIAAIYLREYARQGFLVRSVRIAINNLAGVPSIVFGVFGLGFFIYGVGAGIDHWFYSASLPAPTFGTGGVFWASATLALMTLPVVIVATEESIAAVPRGAKEASLALGATKWQTIRHIVLTASLPGILTGVILAMARGAGEVAPLMVVGVVKLAPSLPLDGQFPFIHLERKFMHLGFHIYDLGFQSPDSEAALPMVYATTLLLIVLVLVMNLGAIILRERLRRTRTTGAF